MSTMNVAFCSRNYFNIEWKNTVKAFSAQSFDSTTFIVFIITLSFLTSACHQWAVNDSHMYHGFATNVHKIFPPNDRDKNSGMCFWYFRVLTFYISSAICVYVFTNFVIGFLWIIQIRENKVQQLTIAIWL